MAVLAVGLCIAVNLMGGATARADTASELADARRKVAEAEAEVKAAAGDLGAMTAKYETLGAQITTLEAQIQSSLAEVTRLQDTARRRAVFAYMHGPQSQVGIDIGSKGPLASARREELLKHANQRDDRVVRQLSALREDLAVQQKTVQAQREEQKQLKDRAAEKHQTLLATLTEVNRARDVLASKLANEQAAAAAAERARLLALRPATPGSVSPGQIIVNPGGGPFQCPVRGSAYTDNFGPRIGGFHYGIDMMIAYGAPEVAVKAGSVHFVPNEGAGGNAIYLYGNDGNTYYYAHSSSFVGGDRGVSQGEIIGLVGTTGNAVPNAPHLHFEIRIGGPNGARIDPFATLQAAGC